MTSRREFIEHAALTAAAATLAISAKAHATDGGLDSHAQTRGFLNLLRAPDSVMAQLSSGDVALAVGTNGKFNKDSVTVTTLVQNGALRVQLSAPGTQVKRIHFRWRAPLSDVRQILGDAWERGYGDLEWRAWAPDRVMPWYFATTNGTLTNAYGVRTAPKAFCFWQVDPQGISLWADVRSGGAGVQLGERTLDVCDVVCRAGRANENAFAAVRAFCKQMCSNPRIPSYPIYGSNDWYWVYGKNSAQSVMTDVHNIVELSPTGGNRPFAVIDDGWQPGRGAEKTGAGTWDRGNDKFPDIAGLAASMKKGGTRPGIWIRPLQVTSDAPDSWRLPRDRAYFDPTVPEVLKKISDDMTRLRQWGFELIKHDYSTFDIFGRWGFQMAAAMTRDNWTFATGSSRTTAEVIDELYRTIRVASGDSIVIGCNTVSHLSAGHFEMCRIGDDTSGTEWPRTRKMGVNTLAFRSAQHDAFYVADADCCGVTTSIPWSLNKQWLDLLSRSGTMLFTSLDPAALGAEQKRDLKEAFARAALPRAVAEPLDWQQNIYPSRWKTAEGLRTYDWVGADGAGLP